MRIPSVDAVNTVHLLRDYVGREGSMWCGRGGKYVGKDAHLFAFEVDNPQGRTELLGTTAMCEVTCSKCIDVGVRVQRANGLRR